MADMMQGALSQVMPQTQPPREMPDLPQAQGSSGMQGLLGMITSRMRPAPSPEQYQQDLGNYIEAIRGPQGPSDTLGAMGEAVLRSGAGDQAGLWGDVGKGLADRVALERDNEYKRNLLAAKAKYEDTVNASDPSRLKGLTNLMGGTPLGYSKDGNPIVKMGTRAFEMTPEGPVEYIGAEKTVLGADTIVNQRSNMVQMVAKTIFEKGGAKTYEEALSKANQLGDAEMQKILQASGVGPRALTPAAETPKVGAAVQGALSSIEQPSGNAPIQIEGGEETVKMMKQRMQELANAGDYSGALELQRALSSGVVVPSVPRSTKQSTTPPMEIPSEATRAAEKEKATTIAKGEGERVVNEPEEFGRVQSAFNQLDNLIDTVNTIKDHPGKKWGTERSGRIPGMDIVSTDVRGFNSQLNHLKSMAVIDTLKQMRNDSKTGGAMGNVSNADLERLENYISSLDPYVETAEFDKNMNKIVEYANKLRSQIKTGYNLKYPESKKPWEAESGSEKSQQKVIGGKTYVKKEDGKWYPQ